MNLAFIKKEVNEKVANITKEIIKMQEFFWSNVEFQKLIEKEVLDDLKGTGVEL